MENSIFIRFFGFLYLFSHKVLVYYLYFLIDTYKRKGLFDYNKLSIYVQLMTCTIYRISITDITDQ